MSSLFNYFMQPCLVMKTTHQLHLQNNPKSLFSTVICGAVSSFQTIQETPDFGQLSPSLQIRVRHLPDNC